MKWRVWLKPERLIPSATILLSFVAQALGLFGVVRLSLGENILLLLIALLAVDALTERLTILEKIRQEIADNTSHASYLQERNSLPPLSDQFANASRIKISGISLLGIILMQQEVLLSKIKSGCNLHLLLLNPENAVLMKGASTYIPLTPEQIATQIKQTLELLSEKKEFSNSSLIQVRITDRLLTHGLLIINGDERVTDGRMRVEIYSVGKMPATSPGFTLQKSQDPNWFDFFQQEFDHLWSQAKPFQHDGGAILPPSGL